MEQRSRLQNYWLIGLAVMTLLAAVLLFVSRSQKGVLFHDALLRVEEQDGQRVYSGKSHGEQVEITAVKRGDTETEVNVTIGDVYRSRYLVEYPLEPVATEHGQKPGLRISQDGQEIFAGAYDPRDYMEVLGYRIYNEHGVWEMDFPITVDTGDSYGGGYWDDYTMDVSAILEFANGQELKARGDWVIFFYGLLMVVLAAVMVAFPKTLFQWSYSWYVKDPEPTETYFQVNRLGSGFLTVVALIFYIVALRTIP